MCEECPACESEIDLSDLFEDYEIGEQEYICYSCGAKFTIELYVATYISDEYQQSSYKEYEDQYGDPHPKKEEEE